MSAISTTNSPHLSQQPISEKSAEETASSAPRKKRSVRFFNMKITYLIPSKEDFLEEYLENSGGIRPWRTAAEEKQSQREFSMRIIKRAEETGESLKVALRALVKEDEIDPDDLVSVTETLPSLKNIATSPLATPPCPSILRPHKKPFLHRRPSPVTTPMPPPSLEASEK